ncbi:uncharacterized protein [Onthophagus taurus]|uniref:uncharacterized protein n=1 Tax=Onthophagus taurus TaxID=166361 RepID=UPI0039BDDBF3
MERLSVRHKVEIVRLVGDNILSKRKAAIEFNNRHPDMPPVSASTVHRVNKVFNDTGSVSKQILKVQNPRREIRNNNQIVEYFHNNPHSSLRTAAIDLNIPRECIRRCLTKNKIKPYKPKFLHTLEPRDEERRLEFCLWAQGEYLENRNFLREILFSDEATFTTNGVVSSQNSRYWCTENPEWIINARRQYSHEINVVW